VIMTLLRKLGLPIVAVVTPTNEWISERVAEMADTRKRGMRGFDRLRNEIPELAETIEVHRQRSEQLREKTNRCCTRMSDLIGSLNIMCDILRLGGGVHDEGIAVNSPGTDGERLLSDPCVLEGMSTEAAKRRITGWLAKGGLGTRPSTTNCATGFFSRQRYWGEPVPVLHGDDGEILLCRTMSCPSNFRRWRTSSHPFPRRRSIASRAAAGSSQGMGECHSQWKALSTRCEIPCRQWAGSCWYYLRFIDPCNKNAFCGPHVRTVLDAG